MVEQRGVACRAGIVGSASVLLVAACTGGGAGIEVVNGDGDGADDLVDGEVAVESDDAELGDGFGEPTPEDTTEEAPAEVEIDPTTIEVATLPIGGDADHAGENLQCVDVGWSDPPEIPTGVTVVIQDLILEPAGHFARSDRSCPGDAPPCLPDHAVTPAQRCEVAVEWTEAAGHGGGWLSASGTIVCDADADVCSAFMDAVAERGGESIELLPPLTGTTPSGNGEGEESSGSSGQDGDQREDSEQDSVEDTPENGQGDAEENGEQNGTEGTTEDSEG